MISIDYEGFSEDCNHIFGRSIEPYGFVLSTEDGEDFTIVYKSNHWKIEISMLSNFPHIGASFTFMSLQNEYVRPGLLREALKLNDKSSGALYRKYFPQDHYLKKDTEQYKTELEFCRDVLHRDYLPLLKGDFKYVDYLTFVNSRNNTDQAPALP
jgi:hypothetical protein